MGLHLSQIFLRGFDTSRLFKRLGPLWSRHIQEDRENPLRQIVLLIAPPWVTLLDSLNSLPRELALELSREAGGQAIWVSVGSNTMTWQLLRAAEGEAVSDRTVPPPDPDGFMPWYVDPEQEAWDELGRLGVPAKYRLIRNRDLENSAAPEGKADMIILERPALDRPIHHGYLRHRIVHPRRHEDGPPSEYTAVKNDLSACFDEYLISGILEEKRADHLLEVLDRIAKRKQRPPEARYRPLVTLLHGTEAESDAAREFLKERYGELSKLRTYSYRL